ncbi:P-loop containing nucleoside triphosphate hydrolase protein [Clohesyomyces aquaticus]|uniref:p-loop containing nucleoside triphosphate hydrolase protein n=1 Tax=Clohesyomyces aquaticus TaxID=1231657 RepID=A0A1Y1Z6P9_9PLEO|nr:P-loop containing nucleoside triphosphate hydrolase protein [Clohesyomyces aquaticus]
MADPLSVAASIIGILAAAGKVAETLGPIVSTMKDADKCAAAVYAEVNTSRIILSALQTLLNDLSASPHHRRQLIQVDQLISALIDGAFIFSELEPLVLRLGTSTEKWTTRMQWARKKDSLDSFVVRLQCFKASISVMLNILQCDSDIEATRRQQELYFLTTNIARRLSVIERPSRLVSSLEVPGLGDTTSIIANESMIRNFEFAHDLENSRVYRNAKRTTADYSFRSSIALSHAWSALSDVSLSDISVISTVALPISIDDLSNGHHYSGLDENGLEVACVGQIPGSDIPPSDISPRPQTPRRSPKEERQLRNGWRNFRLREYKLAVIGGGGVDKSVVSIRFLDYHARPGSDVRSDDWYRPTCVVDDEPGILVVYDTAGQEEYSAMREQYMRDNEGFLLVYSVTNRQSLEELTTFQQQILRVKDREHCPMILVGNHCRRLDQRQVSYQEGLTLARTFGCAVIEVDTSKRGEVKNLETAFYDLVRCIRNQEEREIESEWEAEKVRKEAVKKRKEEEEREAREKEERRKLKQYSRRNRWIKKSAGRPPLEKISEYGVSNEKGEFDALNEDV